MLSIIAAGAVLSFVSPALAGPVETGSFERDGYTYVYKVEQKGESKVITGRSYPGGKKFSLVVRGDMVTGTSNGTPVRFHVAEAASATKSTALSMRD
ncbi:hypothetical protein [Rhizorhapis sp. SPR117]|uniref:hypothetical protein n=1 Tax=Rhizorhapis sp. SPR117 TaxID=2912611 RepID=UPI001F47D068|nr:hypothetical protein [Rhizorhapis sp. SPR117]